MAVNTVEALQARIDHLEENRRFIQNALEMVLSLADFSFGTSETVGHAGLLQEALHRIGKIIALQGCAVYLVDDQSAEFTPVFCDPESSRIHFESHVEFMIEEGFFAWAIRERRGLYTTSRDHQQHLLLHVIANNTRVQGMFIGLMAAGKSTVPETSLTLLTITLFNLANVMESLDLYQMVKNQNILLEQKVSERTRRLNESKQKLKKAVLQLKKLARQAHQANKAKSQFLANMSHEIRTPLNGIIGCTELILKSEALANCRELARISLDESEHLLHLINNVLDYSKIEAGKITLEARPFDLYELLNSVVAGLKPQAEQKRVGLEVRISGHPSAQVLGDSLRLRQILINLTNNAIKFTAKGVVTLAVERQDALSEPGRERIRFAVIDTGIGIAPERQEEIFKPFTQADESTTRRYGGTGLGTTIAYQLVALMGGRLTVASQPEQGATFSFVITLAVDGSAAEKTSENRLVVPVAGTSMIAPACILVAEDTPVNQLVIRRHLESQGHIVSLVGNGREAVAACRARDYDLVLMDVQMPYLDGIQATRQIRGDLCGRLLPILALTANTDAQTRTDCEAAGMDAVLTKPIRREPLLAAVRQWLNQRKGLAPDPLVKTDDVDHGRYAQPDMPLDVNTVIYEFGDSATAREVIEHLLESLPGYSEAIRQACITGDLAAIRKHAHAIKGAAASVEANPLSRAAAVLEDHCRQNASGQVAEAVAGMIASMEDLTCFVRTIPWPPVPR